MLQTLLFLFSLGQLNVTGGLSGVQDEKLESLGTLYTLGSYFQALMSGCQPFVMSRRGMPS